MSEFAEKYSSNIVKVVKARGSTLESVLSDVDTVKLAVELFKHRVITATTKERFVSLDPDHLESDIKVRYLLQQVCERLEEDEKVYDRFVRVLSRLGGGVRAVCEAMRKELEVVGQDVKTEDDVCLKEVDVPVLVELLVSCSHLWDAIGIALSIPEYKKDECRYLRDNPSRLSYIFTAWISGNYKGAKSATLGVLKTVLSSELVSYPKLVLRLNEFKSQTRPSAEPSVQLSESRPEIQYQSYDTKVSEGKSTLLEVQVSCNGSESYQWCKDGQHLHEGADCSGASSNILYISRAGQGTEGKYSCTVSSTSETVCSDEINLKVMYSPEKEQLIRLYFVKKGEVPKDSWPPVSNSTFINLVLVKHSLINNHNYYTVRGDMDDILVSKEVVTYEKVFREYREGELVLVEGRPGSGKTTLVHKVTRDWTKGRHILQGAEMVFLIPLHVLNFTAKDTFLSDILEVFYVSEVLRRRIEHDLQESGGKGACFILDGLDEYRCKNEEESVIHQLMCKKCLPFSMVIVASRPVATEELKKDCDRRIEVVGFTKSQIYEYIMEYPFACSNTCKSDLVSSLKMYLHQHPNVLHMCYLPVHAAMICFLFGKLGDTIPHTETQIYEQFTIATLLRQKKRKKGLQQLKYLQDLVGKDKEDFQSICQLAFDMVVKSQQVVSQSEAPISLSDVTSSALSLLTVEHAYKVHGDEHFYTFHHLTLQEFLAAYYLAELGEQKQQQIIKKSHFMKDKGSQNVLKFCCGLLGVRNSKILESEEIREALFNWQSRNQHVQYAFESQQVGLCTFLVRDGCLEICSSFVTPSDFAALGYVVSAASKLVSKLIFRCTWDADEVMALSCMDTTKKLHFIQCLEVSHHDTKSEALQILLSQLPGLQKLYLNYVFLSEDYIKSLTRDVKLPQLRILKITLPLNPPCTHPEEVLKLLRFGSHKLEEVYVSVSYFGNVGLWKKWLFYAFGFHVFVDGDISWALHYNSNIFSSFCLNFSYCTEVVLVNCGIDDEGVVLLTSRLSTSVVENIVLDFNKICDSGAIALADFMSQCNVLQKVSIECNSISDSGAIALAAALAHCSSLIRLDLQGNSVSDKGAVALAEVAEDNIPHLDLYLYNVNITTDGVKKVLGVRARTIIKCMKFSSSWEAISEAGIDTLRKALKCGSLPALKISCTNIYNIKILVEELEHIKNVKSIVCCEVTDDILPSLCDIIRSMKGLECLETKLCASITSNNAQLFGDVLRSCKYLHSLSLPGTTRSLITKVIKCCSNIQSLDLSYCYIGLDGMTQLFSDHKSWFNLHTLNLRINGFGSDGVQILSKVLAHCYSLCYLDLVANHFDDYACLYLAKGLQHHNGLVGLKLGGNKITSNGVAALLPIIRNNRLQELDLLSRRGSEEVHVTDLMEAICTDTLQKLRLGHVGMALDGIVALSAGLKNCRHLAELYISYGNLGLQGLSFLAEGLQCCTSLKKLTLKNKGITSEDSAAVVNIMKTCKYLRYLFIDFISVEGVADLVVGWQHKTMLTLYWFPDDPHKSALNEGKGCCSRCNHLLQVYNENNYVILGCIPKLLFT